MSSPLARSPDPEAARAIRYREARLVAQVGLVTEPETALEQARTLVADAEALGDSPLLAETRFRLGRIQAKSGDYEAATATQRPSRQGKKPWGAARSVRLPSRSPMRPLAAKSSSHGLSE